MGLHKKTAKPLALPFLGSSPNQQKPIEIYNQFPEQ